MGRQQALQARHEQHVRHLVDPRTAEPTRRGQRRDLQQRSLEPCRVAGELHGRRVGEPLALARDARLDQAPETAAEPAENEQRQAERDHAGRALAASGASRSSVRPISAITISPNSQPIRRMFRRMSPLRMWLNSCATTPCSSSRLSVASAPRVTATAAFAGVAGGEGVDRRSCRARRPRAPARRRRSPSPRPRCAAGAGRGRWCCGRPGCRRACATVRRRRAARGWIELAP